MRLDFERCAGLNRAVSNQHRLASPEASGAPTTRWKEWRRRWRPALLYMGVLLTVSSISAVQLPPPPFDLGDKAVHAVLFAPLGFLARGATGTWLGAVILGVVWGGIDELWQGLVPGRQPDVWDWLADGIGVIVGATIAHVYATRKARRSRPEAPAPRG